MWSRSSETALFSRTVADLSNVARTAGIPRLPRNRRGRPQVVPLQRFFISWWRRAGRPSKVTCSRRMGNVAEYGPKLPSPKQLVATQAAWGCNPGVGGGAWVTHRGVIHFAQPAVIGITSRCNSGREWPSRHDRSFRVEKIGCRRPLLSARISRH